MPLSPTISWEFASSCEPVYFEDQTCAQTASCVSGYGGSNIEKSEVTLTKIILSDEDGNEWEYTDYLPTDGEVELYWENFTQTVVSDDTTTTDTGCGCTTEETEDSTFPDGCFSVQYEVYSGVGGTTLQGSTSIFEFFYCTVRNRIFDLIVDSCSDCCDREKQWAIWEARQQYDDMLTVFNKLENCGCAEGALVQLRKKLDKLEGNCE